MRVWPYIELNELLSNEIKKAIFDRLPIDPLKNVIVNLIFDLSAHLTVSRSESSVISARKALHATGIYEVIFFPLLRFGSKNASITHILFIRVRI